MRYRLLFIPALLTILQTSVAQITGEQKIYQRALLEMEGKGNYLKAAGLFKEIVGSKSQNRSLLARAYLQLGKCREKLGKQDAIHAYQTVIKRFPDQFEAAKEAYTRLQQLSAGIGPNGAPGMVIRRLDPAVNLGSHPVPSPDGSMVAYRKPGSKDTSILCVYDFVRQEEREIVVYGLKSVSLWAVWSPDGKRIAYSHHGISPYRREMRAVTLTTGAVEVLLSRQGETIIPSDWSRDGRSILTVRRDTTGVNIIGLYSLPDHTNVDVSRQYPDVVHVTDWTPKLSPDGNYYMSTVKLNNLIATAVFAVDGTSRSTLADASLSVSSPVWSADGRTVVFLHPREGTTDLLAVKMENGKRNGSPLLIKSDLDPYVSILGLSANGRLFYTRSTRWQAVASVDIDTTTCRANSEPTLLGEYGVNNLQPYWSPSGSAVYYLSERLTPAIRSGGTRVPRLLMSPGREHVEEEIDVRPFNPSMFIVTADSSYVIFDVWEPENQSGIYALFLPTNTITRIFTDTQFFCWTPSWRMFGWDARSRKLIIGCCADTIANPWLTDVYRIGLCDENPEYLFTLESEGGVLSPDGKEIVYVNNKKGTIEIRSMDSDSSRILIREENKKAKYAWPSWSPDGRRILYEYFVLGEANSEIRTIPALGGAAVTIFQGSADYPWPWGPRWSPAGNKLAFSVFINRKPEIWTIENFLPPMRK